MSSANDQLGLSAAAVTMQGKQVDSVRSSAKVDINASAQKNMDGAELGQSRLLKKISNVDIAISIDDSSLPPVVRIMDSATGDEIAQIPTDTSVAIQKSVDELIGLIFDKKA